MTAEVEEHQYIAPEGLTVFRDESNNVRARIEGQGEWEKVVPKLAFPYSDPDRFVILLSEGEEIGMLRELSELEEDSRRLLRELLEKRYHVPEIKRIIDVDDAHNAHRWTVETDKGVRRFLVRDRHNFRRIRGVGKIIIDVDGSRFFIPRGADLDPQSRKLLDLHG